MSHYTEPPVLDLAPDRPGPLTREAVTAFDDQGFHIQRGLISRAEAESLAEEFMQIASGGPIPGHFEPRSSDPGAADPLHTYPRIMHPHLVHRRSMDYLLDIRITDVVAQLLGEEPLACQTMLYFKPPGARGQSLHQDNFYLRVEPSTCIAAWVALDIVDRDNGGLQVVPGTHRMEIFCPEEADESTSFTREHVPPPPGLEAVPADMEPGDVLFFNGQVVHGSGPNTTTDRFRRSFICHYAPGSTRRIHGGYPTARLSGQRLQLPEAEGGGPCGTEFDVAPH
ncbi:phytanoyl-CoA dioxygenase family protein [Isoptericola hypogeus]|uniref:Phytanoyl-CoA dioxygenase family protein n=1 Tax=Isoptericola hypogeus TaxID=300179 RepID=A0ABN2JHJ4_9MICO